MGIKESAAFAGGPASGERPRSAAGLFGAPPGHCSRSPGDEIAGKYVLQGLLGSGGMGSVWHARNLALGTDVAIKLILPALATDEAGERLLREARAAALLDHPSIVRVFDFGRSAEGEPFIVMELLRGPSLGALLGARGRIPARVAVQLLLPVLSALAEAHAKGVIHRDLKPDNVMLVVTPQGSVVPKIVDFGIAKLTREADVRILTRTGAIMGSPDYMAPEQARGAAEIDERADLWAICVVFYEAITGVRPFDGDNYHALLHAVLNDSPLPTTNFAAGDDQLWAILQIGLEKTVERRWQSARALGNALAQWAAARQVDVDVVGSNIRHHWLGDGRLSAVLDLSAMPPSGRPAPPPSPPRAGALPPILRAAAPPRSSPSFAAAPTLPSPGMRPRRPLGFLLLSALAGAVLGGLAWLALAPDASAPPSPMPVPAQPAAAAARPFLEPAERPPAPLASTVTEPVLEPARPAATSTATSVTEPALEPARPAATSTATSVTEPVLEPARRAVTGTASSPAAAPPSAGPRGAARNSRNPARKMPLPTAPNF